MGLAKRRTWTLPLSVLGLLVMATLGCVGSSASAFQINTTYTLGSGQQRTGDRLLVAEKISLASGSAINGDLTLIGSQVNLDAQIDGDTVVVADELNIGDTARIQGDMIVCANTIKRSDSALIAGEYKQECSAGSQISVTNALETGLDNWRTTLFFRLGGLVTGMLFFGALAALSTTLLTRPLYLMSTSARRTPLTTGAVGLLTLLIVAGLSLVYLFSLALVLPLILLPFMLLVWLMVGLLILLGGVALADPIGAFVFHLAGTDDQPRMVTAGVGGMLLMLLVQVWGLFWLTAWVGVLMAVVLGSVGLGAVVLTRAGSRPFPRQLSSSASS